MPALPLIKFMRICSVGGALIALIGLSGCVTEPREAVTSTVAASENLLGRDVDSVCSGLQLTATPGTEVALGADVTLSASASCTEGARPRFQFSYRAPDAASWTLLRKFAGAGTATLSTAGLTPGTYELLAEVRASTDRGPAQQSVSRTVRLGILPSCAAGYAPDASGLCVDSDECALLTDNCDPLAACSNVPGSFTCGSCPADTIDVNADGTLCTRFTQVAAGWNHSCATTADGQLYCWGDNHSGQLGDGTTTGHSLPARVGSASDWDSVAVGYYASCGLRSGSLYCWGLNTQGQLGVGATADSPVPVQVGTETDWLAVDLGYYHACGLRGGSLYCWGFNGDGELGVGSTVGSTSPLQVGSDSDWLQLAVGGYHSCATRGTGGAGSLYCWGWNAQGQLGIASTANSGSPTQVGSASDWDGVSAGASHSCGTRDGRLYCWGNNKSKQLGDGTAIQRTAPAQVGTASDWSGVAAGGNHSCGTRGAGSLYCWGANSQGQLGDGSTLPRATPTAIGTASDWADASSGDYHTCAARGAGVSCWGQNGSGQLGDGSATARNTAGSVIHP
jgi:alpha-tubulin suppressor-like RCC1 family protein